MGQFQADIPINQIVRITASRPGYVGFDQHIDIFIDGMKVDTLSNDVAAYAIPPAPIERNLELHFWWSGNHGEGRQKVMERAVGPLQWKLDCYDGWGDDKIDHCVTVQIGRGPFE